MIPDYQSIRLPRLQSISDQNEYKMSIVADTIAKNLKSQMKSAKSYCPVAKMKYLIIGLVVQKHI